jgi:hypothetical protein
MSVEHWGITHRNVDNIDNIISQLSGVICGQIIASAFYKEELATKFSLQSLQSAHVGTYVFSNCCMGTSSRLYGEDAIFRKGLVFYEEFLIFSSEDVVGDGSLIIS